VSAPYAPRPDCMRCRAYFVTHVPERPHGCRAFGFTSARLPRDEVRLSTGQECAAFEERPAPARTQPPR
jgi:hypothetical protein